MLKSSRVLTHKSQRHLNPTQVENLLYEYVHSDVTYEQLSIRYGVSTCTVSRIVRGLTYRDLLGMSHLREKAQKKARERSAKYSDGEAVRIPDEAVTLMEVNFNSVESVKAAILRLEAVLSLLNCQVANAHFGRTDGDFVSISKRVQIGDQYR